MKISTKSRYGLRILADIAINMKKGEASKGRDIAERQNLTEAYLEQIMIPLKSNGFIRTQRGCKGGYILNKSLKEITVLNIIESFEGKINFVDCVDTHECDMLTKCATRNVWCELSDVFREKASSITLQDIVDSHHSKSEIPDFVI